MNVAHSLTEPRAAFGIYSLQAVEEFLFLYNITFLAPVNWNVNYWRSLLFYFFVSLLIVWEKWLNSVLGEMVKQCCSGDLRRKGCEC